MDNGIGLSANDIALGSLLTRGGGYGGGAWGGGYFGSPFASFGSNAVRIDRNRQTIEDQADCTREVIGLQVAGSRQAFEGLERMNQFTSIRDGQFQSELRTNDRIAALQAEINANAREAALCCCNTQKEIAMVESRLTSEIKAVESRNIERALNAANAELISLRQQVACGCVTGCSTPCTTPA